VASRPATPTASSSSSSSAPVARRPPLQPAAIPRPVEPMPRPEGATVRREPRAPLGHVHARWALSRVRRCPECDSAAKGPLLSPGPFERRRARPTTTAMARSLPRASSVGHSPARTCQRTAGGVTPHTLGLVHVGTTVSTPVQREPGVSADRIPLAAERSGEAGVWLDSASLANVQLYTDPDDLACGQSGLPELVGIFGGFRGSATTFTLVVALRSICRCQNM
jgi:hypothetical protein